MANIPNTEYITVKRDENGQVGIFVGGKPATHYRGETIRYSNAVRESFADIQRLNKNVAELHVLSSETRGEYVEPGNPSGKHGPNTWCRVKFENGNLGAWVFSGTIGSTAGYAYGCAYAGAYFVRAHASFRSAVFDLGDKQKPQESKYNGVKMYKKVEDYPIKNTVVLSDKNGNYHVAFDSKIGREEFSGTRAEVLEQMTLRVKRLLNIR